MAGIETVGVVIIGRNEGDRLRRCLESVPEGAPLVVYVDSGSTDGSVALARSLGAEVVELDMSSPFTAARARNAGIVRLKELRRDLSYVQVIDGDCELFEDWVDEAVKVMQEDENAAVICGRVRERHPESSKYNRLCDLEWGTPEVEPGREVADEVGVEVGGEVGGEVRGEVDACGGIALIRLEAFDAAGGFDPTLIAGEEPELCLRMRREGWRILRLDRDMVRHDAQMTSFRQWWRRRVRCGYAYAEGRVMHGESEDRYRVHEVRSIVEWALVLPVLAVGLAAFTWGASLALLGGYAALFARVRRWRSRLGDSDADASLYARYCVLGKFAEAQGVIWYGLNRLLGRAGRLIEYK